MRSEVAVWSAVRVGGSPSRVIGRFCARKAARSGLLWGYVFGMSIGSSALGYVLTYKTVASREVFAATFGSNAGLDAITGPGVAIQTVAGYTVWKSLAFVSILGAIWGLLISTRLLRGEEEAGRWELLLAGRTTRRRATAQVVAGLGTGLAVTFALTALICIGVGSYSKVDIDPAAMTYLAAASVSAAAVFIGVGALASQLVATRRRASAYAGGVLAVAYALRMIADSGAGLAWLRWATPLGWVEELQPLTAPRPLAFLPIVGLTAVLVGISIHLAGRRDLGDSILRDKSSARPRTHLLNGPLGLAYRLARLSISSWFVAVVAMGMVLGFIAKQAGEAFSVTPSIERVLRELGVHAIGAQSYLGLSSEILAVLIFFVAIAQITAIRSEESEGHLEHFLIRPVGRRRWLVDRISLSVVVIVTMGLGAGLSTWLGATAGGAGVGIGVLVNAGLNLVAPSLFLFGVGVLAFGMMPRITIYVTYGLVVWSFLIELVGGIVNSNHWLLDTSLLHQMAPAPGVPVDWTSDALLVALGALAAVIGGAVFSRRDLVGD